jgi:DNA-binding NtrC family response regulator/glycosyltransferase involved in cell wall biosynthesis
MGMLGNHPPRLCGLATFTSHLREALDREIQGLECFVLAMNDPGMHYAYPPEVRLEIPEADLAAYQRASARLNAESIDVMNVQHEYGIFGGRAGAYLLTLLRDLRMPIVTTLHTILRKPDPDQLAVMNELTRLSQRVVVMSSHGAEILKEVHGVPAAKIDFIPHGIPDIPFSSQNKGKLGLKGKNMILTFGLLSPDKGIEYVIDAMPSVLAKFPDTVYTVLGATHPHLKERQGESYRQMLQDRAEKKGVAASVILDNRYVSQEELNEILGAADIYITPYLNEEQITSGTLAYAIGCGKAVISTPYLYAKELLANERGILVPWRDPAAIARELLGLLGDEAKRMGLRQRAAAYGRTMSWPTVAKSYLTCFERARMEYAALPRVSVETMASTGPTLEQPSPKPGSKVVVGTHVAVPLEASRRTRVTSKHRNLVFLNFSPLGNGLALTLRRVSEALKLVERTFGDPGRVNASVGTNLGEAPSGIVARSPVMLNLLDMAQRVAKVDATLLITGETGSGKERLARFVHEQSARAAGPFLAVNCGAISETLFESELFGHARGAFTGATHERQGLFEAANHGTLLLDEIAEVTPALQVKLLRAIQEREIRRVGENQTRRIDVRILAATNRNLAQEVEKGSFREDLYYRLRVVELHVPSLRERRADILPLAHYLLAGLASRMNRKISGFAPRAASQLMHYAWPGNVRELENALERAVALAMDDRVEFEDLPQEIIQGGGPTLGPESAVPTLREVEKNHILTVLALNEGNQIRTAEQIDIGAATLYRKLKSYGMIGNPRSAKTLPARATGFSSAS